MKALRSHTPGGPETLVLEDVSDPEPKAGEVLVAIKACGVNYPDFLTIQDLYQTKPPRPFAPGTEIAGDAFRPEGRGAQELVESAEQRVFQIAEAGARGRQGFVPVRTAVKEAFRLLQERFESRSPITGLPTGYNDFDYKTAGLQPGDLIIIAARPSMGKCLSEDAEIVQDDGSIRTIGEMCRSRFASSESRPCCASSAGKWVKIISTGLIRACRAGMNRPA